MWSTMSQTFIGWMVAKKRFQKSFVKVIRQTSIKLLCRVVNFGGIKNAKDRQSLDKRIFREAQQHLIRQQNNLANQRVQYFAAQRQFNEANFQLQTLTTQLHKQ